MGGATVLMLATLLANAMSVSSAAWISSEDYPQNAKKKHEQGWVHIALLIGLDGKVERCQIMRSTGFLDLDQKTCALIEKRARFKPARDEQGIATYGTYKGAFIWLHPDASIAPGSHNISAGAMLTPDLELDVAKLPDKARQRDVFVVAHTDSVGGVVACEPMPSNEEPAILGPSACVQLKRFWKTPLMDLSGKPVSAVQTFKIRFNAAGN
jgi:TonB family protein